MRSSKDFIHLLELGSMDYSVFFFKDIKVYRYTFPLFDSNILNLFTFHLAKDLNEKKF